MGRPFVDRVGERYGRLTVIEYMGCDAKSHHFRKWKCLCDCGKECVVNYRELSRGHTKSCGCLFQETIRKPRGANALPVGESAFNQFFYLYRKSARERGYCFELSKDQFREISNQPCWYCGTGATKKFHATKGTNGSYYGSGVDRIDNTKGYTLENVRPCCKQCNIAKGVLPEADFFNWVAQVAKHMKL